MDAPEAAAALGSGETSRSDRWRVKKKKNNKTLLLTTVVSLLKEQSECLHDGQLLELKKKKSSVRLLEPFGVNVTTITVVLNDDVTTYIYSVDNCHVQ